MDHVQLAEPEMFTVWFFTEKVHQPLGWIQFCCNCVTKDRLTNGLDFILEVKGRSSE